MGKTMSKKADIELLNSINLREKILALRSIHRDGLIRNSNISERFLEAIKLKEDRNVTIENRILNSIYNSFSEEFQNYLSIKNDFLVYSEDDYEVFTGLLILSDVYDSKWVLFACFININDLDSYNKGSTYSIINYLNKQPYLGVWSIDEDGENETRSVILTIGFTMKLDNWTSITDKYASNIILDFFAVSTNLLSEGNFISKAEEKIKLDLLWYQNSNQKKPRALITEGIENYLAKINIDLRNALEVKDFDNYFRIRLPLKGTNNGFFCDLFLGYTNHDILGPCMNIKGNLPGLLKRSVAELLVAELNYNNKDDQYTIHTTPKLIGRWVANDQGEEIKCSISFIGLVQFNEISNFTIAEHIEGLVKELCVSWLKVDEHLFFDTILEKDNYV